MDKFIEKIKNKRVAILGPADYVNKEFDNKHGEYINNFDTVIRLNSMIRLPSEIKKKNIYGNKFDILFSSFWPYIGMNADKTNEINTSRYLYLTDYIDISNNLLIFDFSTEHFSKKYIQYKFKNFFKKNKNFKFINSIKNYNKYFKKKYNLKLNPTSGFCCISLCLEYQPKELYISGMTFYQDKKYNGYYDGYNHTPKEKLIKMYKNPSYCFDGKKHRKLKVIAHNMNNEYYIFKLLMKNNKNIKIDKYLQEIFN